MSKGVHIDHDVYSSSSGSGLQREACTWVLAPLWLLHFIQKFIFYLFCMHCIYVEFVVRFVEEVH